MSDRLYLEISYRRVFDAEVVASDGGWCRFPDGVLYPGGGEPADR